MPSSVSYDGNDDRCAVPLVPRHSGRPLVTPEPLPLRVGDTGDAVADLQERLVYLGLDLGEDKPGVFGTGTQAAVRAFQAQRGLRQDGVCGKDTWSAVVEAGFRLGDRLLYHRRPMLHGDDVAEVQRRLSSLGFDPGGVDGIFGVLTHLALTDFQHNAGVAPDGICGQRTLAELFRVAPLVGGADLVSSVRERLRVADASATLRGRRIAVGEEGGFATGAAAVCRALVLAGAVPVELHHPDATEQAADANSAGVDCYLGLRLEPTHASVVATFYRGFRYESVASRHLAEFLLESAVQRLGLHDGGVHGMALPILRETQMPAVLLELGAPDQVVMHTTELAQAVVQALDRWLAEPWESP